MSLNAFMHPRNIYKDPPNFKSLVEHYPEIRQHMTTDLTGRTRFNFTDPVALRALTRILLVRDFQLEVTIPPGRLVPTLPNRLNYLLWLEDILQQAIKLPDGETPRALDVGAGAVAVYCLLGARRGWHMVGTESDPEALAVARDNVANNQLQDHVQLVAADDTLITNAIETAGDVHFTLCNPPFYDSENPEQGAEARAQRPPPPAANSGLRDEVSCPGGERAFVQRMIDESAQLRQRCCVFSTMLGHKSSVRPLKKAAYVAGASDVITTELCQGVTKRWALAWTFRADLPLKHVSAMKQVKKRTPRQWTVPRDLEGIDYNVPALKQHVVDWLEEIDAKVEPGNCNKYFASYKVTAMEDTWTHVRRRRRAQQRAAAAAAAAASGADAAASPPSAEVTSDLEPSPASADLASPACSQHDLSATSEASDLSASAGAEEHAAGDTSAAAESALKRTRADEQEGGDAETEDDPAAKRPCLEQQMDAVTLQDAVKKKARRPAAPRPALVFTLFVQRKGADILLQLSHLTGTLGSDALNGVLTYLRNQVEKRVRAPRQPPPPPQKPYEPPPVPVMPPRPSVSRALGGAHMRGRICLDAPLNRSAVSTPEAAQQQAETEGQMETAAETATTAAAAAQSSAAQPDVQVVELE